MFYVVPFIMYYYFHFTYRTFIYVFYICILQNEDEWEEIKNICLYVLILIYFLYVEIKYMNQNFIK